MKTFGLLSIVLIALMLSSIASYVHATSGVDWTTFTLNNNNSRYQADSTINSSNVANIVEKWQINTGAVTSTPIVFDGNVYFADWNWSIYSANVLTGAPNWRVNTGNTISSTLCVYNGIVYASYGLSGPIGVIALNEYNGEEIWNNVISSSGKQIWASPIFYNGLIYIGATGLEDASSSGSTKGNIYALNAQTGALVWNFSTSTGTSGGNGVWGSVVVDPELNSIYFGTGNPYVNASPSNSLYGYAIMSVNATNGNINWYRQLYANLSDGQDNDFGSTPNLFSMVVNGVTYNAIGLGNKNGIYYILNRVNGDFLKNLTVESHHLYTGIIGLAGFVYPTSNLSNPELFIPSYYHYISTPTINGTVEAIYPSNDAIAWKVYTPGVVDGSVSEIPGAVLFGDNFSNFYVLNMSTGNVLFAKNFGSEILAGVTPADGYILVPLAGFLPGQTSGISAFTVLINNTKKTTPTIWNSSTWSTVSPFSNASHICYLVSRNYTAVSPSWCQNNTTLYQTDTSNGWKILLLNYTHYSNFELNMQTSILSGNALRVLIYYNSSGNFYSLTLSKAFNSITFDTWKDWNRTSEVKLSPYNNNINNTIEVIGNDKNISISLNNQFLARINDTNYSSGKIGLASDSASVIVRNLTVYSSIASPTIKNGFSTSDIVLLLGVIAVFAFMVILRRGESKKVRNITSDFIAIFIITFPALLFLFLGYFPGFFFIAYILYLYIVYLVYTRTIKFDTKNIQKAILIIVATLILQSIVAPFDWYIIESFKGSALLYLAGTYDNLLFYKLEPIIWLLFSFMYFLGDREDLGTSIKIFLVGIFVTFSSVEDFLYYILSGTALPIQFPWITTVTSLLGTPLTQTKLVVWLCLMIVLSIFVMLLPIQEIFKKTKKKT